MRSSFQILLVAGVFCLAPSARGDSEIVIAIRYLQAQGTSHSHLYLFREDGKLLQQLTNDDSGQDSVPIFSPDGEIVVFTREEPNNMREFWSVKPDGTDFKKLDAAPDWYAQTKSSPYFTNIEPEHPASATTTSSPVESASTGPLLLASYKSPNGSVELVLRLDMNEEDDQINGPGHGKHYLLRDLKTGTETEFSKVPGFYGAAGLLHNTEDKNLYFLFDGSLRVAFFDCI